MSLKTHIESLNKKHEELKEQIHQAYTHHLPVIELKKQKLKIKDEIESLTKSESVKREAA